MDAAQHLYLDLLKRTLTGMVYEDPSSPVLSSAQTSYAASVRQVGGDWPSRAHTMIGRQRLDNLQFCIEQVLADDVPGDLIECLPGDALVSVPAGRAVRAVRRFYSGPLIKITTASGHQLSATPNHPVFTRRGWILAGTVEEGDYVVSRAELKGVGISDPHVDNVPTPIGEIFDSLKGRRCERGPLQAVNFDICDSGRQVEVVTADSPLSPNGVAVLSKPLRQQVFTGADLSLIAFAGNGFGSQGRFASSMPLLRLRSESQRCFNGIRVTPGTSKHSLTGSGVRSVPGSAHSLADSTSVTSVLSSKGSYGLTSQVATDRVIGVRSIPYSGHVYNLQTTTGWYLADDITVHNCGVWRGGACIFMRGALRAYGVTDRTVWVADSFCGFPQDTERGDDRSMAASPNQAFLAVTQEQVAHNFELYGLLDDQVQFLPGFFADTLPSAPVSQLVVLRLDGDLYASTTDALSQLYPKLSSGGFVIIDDWNIPMCQQAVDDYRAAHDITEPITGIDQCGVFWRKP